MVPCPVHACGEAWPDFAAVPCAVDAKASLSSQAWTIEARKEREARRPKTSVRFARGVGAPTRSIDRAQDLSQRGTVAQAASPQVVSTLGFAKMEDASRDTHIDVSDPHIFVNTLGDPSKFTSDYEFELQMLLDRQVSRPSPAVTVWLTRARSAGGRRAPPCNTAATLA